MRLWDDIVDGGHILLAPLARAAIWLRDRLEEGVDTCIGKPLTQIDEWLREKLH